MQIKIFSSSEHSVSHHMFEPCSPESASKFTTNNQKGRGSLYFAEINILLAPSHNVFGDI